jgi:predicted O-methyltransferase YrrM
MNAQWSAVDAYLAEKLLGEDPALEAALAANHAGGLPAIDVSPTQGKFLHLLARAMGARRILEVGTLGGYSTIWLARALPDGGRLVTFEAMPRHAEVARANIAAAGLADRVEVIVGPALTSLPTLTGVFDLVFIDADKESYDAYYERALVLVRPGGLILLDNMLWGGAVADPADRTRQAASLRTLAAKLHRDERIALALLPLGDGLALARRRPR